MSAAARAATAAATEARLTSLLIESERTHVGQPREANERSGLLCTHVLVAVPVPRSLRLLPPPTLPEMLPFLRAPTTVPEGSVTSPPGSLRVDDGFSADGQTHSRPALRQRLQSGLLLVDERGRQRELTRRDR
jgi:hypothetical protein